MSKRLDRSDICVPVVAKKDSEIKKQIGSIIEKNKDKRIDIVEFRADYYENLNDFNELSKVLKSVHASLKAEGIKLLFTIRSEREGGEKLSFSKPCINDINLYVVTNKLADYVDVEFLSEKETAARVIKKAKEKDVKIIASSHDFTHTPSVDEMVERYKSMQGTGADIIKLAVMPHSNEDVDKLCDAVSIMYDKYAKVPVVGISMGELGRLTRQKGYEFGSAITFAVVEKTSAPGQISLDEIE